MSKAEAHVALQSNDTFQQGVQDCLPTVFGYLSIGIAAGVIAKTAGFSIIAIAFMSTLIYAGSAQCILAGMYAAGAPASAIIFIVLFVNLRHLLMSSALSVYFTNLPLLTTLPVGSQIP
uniref:AzlC family ABC transporter permease n=1 Tax=Bacillus sp. S1-R5C1-FB TaxID=1973491 RepID=UPI0015C518EB